MLRREAKKLSRNAGIASFGPKTSQIKGERKKSFINLKVKKTGDFKNIFRSPEKSKIAEVLLKKYLSKKKFSSVESLVSEVLRDVKKSGVSNTQHLNKNNVLMVIRQLVRYGFLG